MKSFSFVTITSLINEYTCLYDKTSKLFVGRTGNIEIINHYLLMKILSLCVSTSLKITGKQVHFGFKDSAVRLIKKN